MDDTLKTSHVIHTADARRMTEIEDQSTDLIITSPPYPMIEMWDDLFGNSDPGITDALSKGENALAFEKMHCQLDPVWDEGFRILKPGGIACINIGDATRSINGHFQLYSNHARIINKLLSLGFSQLPTILWRKPTNAPNKFMGSGMLPPGAYVTLEHEHILIFRKGPKRVFNDDQKIPRRQSAYFWEERNMWFSDIWLDLRGASQKTNRVNNRRSGAFPLELPFRLINMFSIHGDRVVDPFIGSGTTMIAAMCAARNSIGYEIDKELTSTILEKLSDVPAMANQIISSRLDAHKDFVQERMKTKGDLRHTNRPYGFEVMTRQEEDLQFLPVLNIQYQSSQKFKITYGDIHSQDNLQPNEALTREDPKISNRPAKSRQIKMF